MKVFKESGVKAPGANLTGVSLLSVNYYLCINHDGKNTNKIIRIRPQKGKCLVVCAAGISNYRSSLFISCTQSVIGRSIFSIG